MKFLSFAFLVLLTTILSFACKAKDDDTTVPDPEPEPKVTIAGHIIVSLIKQNNGPTVELVSDTLQEIGDEISVPAPEGWKVVSTVYTGDIIKIGE